MEFNEIKALEIVAKYQLKPETIQKWKGRGFIPERYANNYVAPDTRTAFDREGESVVLKILSNKKLNLKAIFHDLKIPLARYNDAKRVDNKRVPLQVSDVIIIVRYLKNLSQKLQYDLSIFSGNITFQPEEKHYIEDTLIQFPINALNVLECQAKDKIYCRFLQRRKKPTVKFEDWEALEMCIKLYKLVKEIEIYP